MNSSPQVTGRIQTQPRHDGNTIVTITAPAHNEFSGEFRRDVVKTVRPYARGVISSTANQLRFALPTPVVTGQTSPEVLEQINGLLTNASCDPIVLDVREPVLADRSSPVALPSYAGTVQRRGYSVDLPFGPVLS